MTAEPRNRAADLARLRRWQPRAVDVRHEGRCPVCKRAALYSYVLDGDPARLRHEGTEEDAGFWCGACGWRNAGSRKYEGEA